MSKNIEKGSDDMLFKVAIIFLIVYNAIYTIHQIAPDKIQLISSIQGAINEKIGYFTLFELLGVVALFVDTIINFDKFESNTKRFIRVILVGYFVMSFIFKLFTNYLDSALM